MARSGRKLLPLEGLRGIAAIIVVLYHMVLGFTPHGAGTVPHGCGVFAPLIQFGLELLNGGAAVSVFFVLSGFILSLPFARDRRLSRIIFATLKRWPRLAGLTVIACLFAYLVIIWSGHDYKQAAHVIGAGWLASHGNSPINIHQLTPWQALRDGLVRVFTQGDVRFDSPLWTMRIELLGSFGIFLAAPLLFALRSWVLRLTLAGCGAYLCGTGFPQTYFTDFLAGTLLAILFAEDKLPVLHGWRSWLAGGAALYMFSFTYEQNLLIHAPLKAALPPGDSSHFVWDAGAALMIALLLGNPLLRATFSRHWAAWLGRLSFPIYLLHGPIMLSLGAASFLAALAWFGMAGSAMIAVFASMAITLLCAVPLAWIDRGWTGTLSWTARWLEAKLARNQAIKPGA